MLDHTVRKDLETTPRKHTDLYLEQPLVATCDDDKKEKERSATKTNQTKLVFSFFFEHVTLFKGQPAFAF